MRHAERGNMLFYVLIAVVLLAALSYAVARSSRGNMQQLNQTKVDLYATEILEYVDSIANAVAQLRLRGCGELEISFENNVEAGYVNAGAPADNSCHVFHVNGGGVIYKEADEAWLDVADFDGGSNAVMGEWRFTFSDFVDGVGDACVFDDPSCVDMLVVLPYLKNEICIAINDKVGIVVPHVQPEAPDGQGIPEEASNHIHEKFTGAIPASTRSLDAPPIFGMTSACTSSDNGTLFLPDTENLYYRVLITR